MNKPSATPMLDALIEVIRDRAETEGLALIPSNLSRVRSFIEAVINNRFASLEDAPHRLLWQLRWVSPAAKPLKLKDLSGRIFTSHYESELAQIAAILARYLVDQSRPIVTVEDVIDMVLEARASGHHTGNGVSAAIQATTFRVVRIRVDSEHYRSLLNQLGVPHGELHSAAVMGRVISDKLVPRIQRLWDAETAQIISDPMHAG